MLLFLLLFLGARAQDVFDGCPLVGDSKDARHMAANALKNRWLPPADYDTMTFLAFSRLTVEGINQLRGVVVEGYVIGVKASGAEACNCHKKDAAHTDTHITIVGDPRHTAGKDRIIVEVTPRNRITHPKWTSRGLRWLKGHWVRFAGWQFWDTEHENAAELTHPRGKFNWRKTPAEAHGLFGIEVIR